MIIPIFSKFEFIKKVIENKYCFLYGDFENKCKFLNYLISQRNEFSNIFFIKDLYSLNSKFSMVENLYLSKIQFQNFLQTYNDTTLVFNNGPLYGIGLLTYNVFVHDFKMEDFIVDDICLDMLKFLQKNDKCVHILLSSFSKNNFSFKENCILLVIKEICINNNFLYLDLKI